ncbi:MAG: DUF1554 domain-containing protein, partial [Thermomicrobiales bacterium]|nr:DUF1554 domain-containing protein [Thermomicrobiales bacterium]
RSGTYVPPPGCGAGGPCLVFLSSTPHQGNLGGVSGADAKCQAAATAAKLPGTYKAWLSDSHSDSSPNIRFTRSAGPYQLVTGVTVAANWADLVDGNLAASINVTENGGVVVAVGEAAWTNTRADGSRLDSPSHCDNWQSNAGGTSGRVGIVIRTDHVWTDASTVSCENHAPLYCFQQS